MFVPFLLPAAGAIYAFKQSGFSGQMIVLILFAGSIFAWSVMITKWMQLKRAKYMSDRFAAAYRSESQPLGLYLKKKHFEGSPLFRVYERTCDAVGAIVESAGSNSADLFMGGIVNEELSLSDYDVNGLDNLAERITAAEALSMEVNMGFLATCVASAPLLGLLGTVWGVMDAFGGMAVSGAAMLSAVAPGISGALLTTVIGLVVAIPSTIGYNVLSARIRRLCVEMENFAQELISDIERTYVKRGMAGAKCAEE